MTCYDMFAICSFKNRLNMKQLEKCYNLKFKIALIASKYCDELPRNDKCPASRNFPLSLRVVSVPRKSLESPR